MGSCKKAARNSFLTVRHTVWVWVAAGLLSCAGVAAQTITPDRLVADTANAVAERIAGREAQLSADPRQLYALVDEVFLPVFDTQYAGRLVLGRHNRSVTPEQRERFIQAFYEFLVRSYADSVLKFRKDRIQVLPVSAEKLKNSKRVVVRTRMSMDDGTVVSVDYSLHMTPKGWRIYDVRIQGVSYVRTYRSQFDQEISARGIEAVIARLESDAKALSKGSRR